MKIALLLCVLCFLVLSSDVTCSDEFGTDNSKISREKRQKKLNCPDGFVYDPYFKKCQELICLPWQKKVGNRCVSN